MRKLAAVILFVAMICSLFACDASVSQTQIPTASNPINNATQPPKASSPALTEPVPEADQSTGNITNGGYATLYNNEIYFANGSDPEGSSDGKLYKADRNGDNIVKLNVDRVKCVNVAEDWVYYCVLSEPWDEEGTIVRTKTDGSKTEEFPGTSGSGINVAGGWIYYCSETVLYKMRTDGTEKTMLDVDTCSNLIVSDDWIYYLKLVYENDAYSQRPYKMKTDKTNRAKICDDDMLLFTVAGDWLYYINWTDENKLYKVEVNGNNRTKVSDMPCYSINLSGDFVYFTSDSRPDATLHADSLFRMKPDGTGVVLLTTVHKNEYIKNINIVGDWVFFDQFIANERYFEQFKIKTDGTGYAKVMKTSVQTAPADSVRGNSVGNLANGGVAALYENQIYFTDGLIQMGADYRRLYKADLNGENSKELCNDPACFINIVDDWIYYSNIKGIYRIKTDGSLKEKLSDYEARGLHVVGDWIYFTNRMDGGCLYKMKLDGTAYSKLDVDRCSELCVVGDWIYYTRITQDGEVFETELYKIRTDGTERSRISQEDCTGLQVVGDSIYYTNWTGIQKINIYTKKKETVRDAIGSSMNICGDWVYFTRDVSPNPRGHSDEIYKMRLDGSHVTKISNMKTHNYIYGLNVVGDWIFFGQYFGYYDSTQYKIRLDGTGYAKVE